VPSAPTPPKAASRDRREPGLRAEVLVAGLDRRPGRPGGGRTDSLLLLFLDERTAPPARLGIVSIPRDLYVDVPGHGPARINATLRIARRLAVDGPELLQRVVEDTLGVTVGHVVLVDLAGFEAMVDAAGGVRVAVPCPIVDDFEDPRTPTGRRVLDVPAGSDVPMDGATAAMYVRSRHGRSDFSRARRQQAVVEALVRKAREPASLLRLPALLRASQGLVETGATRAELLRLAHRVIGAARAPVRKVVLGARVTTPHRTPEGRSVLLAEPGALRTAVRGLFGAGAAGDRPPGSPCPAADVALTRPSTGEPVRRPWSGPRPRNFPAGSRGSGVDPLDPVQGITEHQ